MIINLFPVNKLDLDNPSVLIRPEQADTTRGKRVIIGNPRTEDLIEKPIPRKVVIEKLPDGEETIMITVKGSSSGGHDQKAEEK